MPRLRWPSSRRLRNTRTLVLALVAILFPIAWISARSSEPIPPPAGAKNIRIATYNIRAGLGGIRGITEDLKSLSADIIAIQEVERGKFGSRKIDQASTLDDNPCKHLMSLYAPGPPGGRRRLYFLPRWTTPTSI